MGTNNDTASFHMPQNQRIALVPNLIMALNYDARASRKDIHRGREGRHQRGFPPTNGKNNPPGGP
jgi:hypothetical protein